MERADRERHAVQIASRPAALIDRHLQAGPPCVFLGDVDLGCAAGERDGSEREGAR